MAKVKKFAAGGVSTLGDMIGAGNTSSAVSSGGGVADDAMMSSSGGGAQSGIDQINSGVGTVQNAVSTAQSALGGYRKGGAVKKRATAGGRMNLKSSVVSTAQKNKSQSNW